MPSIIHIVLNDFSNDNRVRKAAECSSSLGLRTYVFALQPASTRSSFTSPAFITKNFSLITRHIPLNKIFLPLKYFEILARMLVDLLKIRPTIIHANDLDALPIAFLAKLVTGSYLIYDSHELWSRAAHFDQMPRFIYSASRVVESLLSANCDNWITVSSSIAKYMSEDLGLPHVNVVRNIPDFNAKTNKKLLRSSLGISKESICILYQGSISGEGVFVIAEAFKLLKSNAVLIFLGEGAAVTPLKHLTSAFSNRVYFHPFVEASELHSYTSDADIGVHPMISSHLNHQFALPNKFFEYINAGLALAVTDLPEMSSYITKYALGKIFKSGDPYSLAEVLEEFINYPGKLSQFKANSRLLSETLNWDNESKILSDIYNSALQSDA